MKVTFEYDLSKPEDRDIVTKIQALHAGKQEQGDKQDAVEKRRKHLVEKVKRTEVFKQFISPLVRKISSDKAYTAKELAAVLGANWTTRRVAARITVLGRPEAGCGVRIFERPEPGKYQMTMEMLRDLRLASYSTKSQPVQDEAASLAS